MTKLPCGPPNGRSLALLASLLVLSPALAGAAPPTSLISSPSLGAEIGRLSYGAQVALDLPPGGLDAGPRLTGEVMYGFMDLAPQLRLDLGGRVSWAYHGSGTPGLSQWLLDFVPDVKIRYAVNDQVGVYGDFGMGLGILDTDLGPYGSDTTAALTVQFGAGAVYALTPNINVLGEIRFDIYTKSGSGTYVAIPTVGLEFH
jgi:opacity protein-like surface antigen